MGDLILSPRGRRYGALPQTTDLQDLSLFAMLSVNLPIPPKTNNRIFMGPIKNQGNEGSCTAHATTSEEEFLQRKFKNNRVVLSQAFLYYLERQLEGTLGQGDCGAQVRTGVKAMNQFGCCTLPEMPYVAGDFNTPPTSAELQQALQYAKGPYHSIGLFADMKTCLASGYGFCLGFLVYSSFEGDDVANTGLMPVPDPTSEQLLGLHDVFVLDYDDTIQCPKATSRGALVAQNSWGSGWGDAGTFFMPFEVAANAQMVDAAWMQHLGKPWVPN